VSAPKKVIVRVKGGLGNQLFCYAAARRLALSSNAELVIDHVTGFVRDRQHRRRYALDPFAIPARKATPAERMEPFERYRRAAKKLVARSRPFERRRYLEQEGRAFDARLLTVAVKGTLYLDGLWQSERYIKDVEERIREDLRIVAPKDASNQALAEDIRNNPQAIGVHVRWFGGPDDMEAVRLSSDYYRRAFAVVEERVESPHYYLFSDDPEATRARLDLANRQITHVAHNQGDDHAYADLWLMTKCRHFVIASSTFSWWGAWLTEEAGTIVVCPGTKLTSSPATSWHFPGQVPTRWLTI
jgi:hypothetical protein